MLNGFCRDLKYAGNITVFPGSQFLPENISRYEKLDKYQIELLNDFDIDYIYHENDLNIDRLKKLQNIFKELLDAFVHGPSDLNQDTTHYFSRHPFYLSSLPRPPSSGPGSLVYDCR